MRTYSVWLGTLSFPALRVAAARLTAKPPSGITFRSASINGVTVKRFAPKDQRTERTVLYLHGGGYVFGSAEQDAAFIGRLALSLGAEVVAPDYRLAPESPCPAAIEDALAVCEGLRNEEVPAEKLSLVGLSSGAGVALATLQLIRDKGLSPLRSAILLSPMLDCAASSKSWTENAEVDWGEREVIVRWARAYAGDRPLGDATVSPIHGDLRGLPPVLVVAGGLELGIDDAKLLAEKMKVAGTSARLHVAPGMVHAFMTFDEKVAPAASVAMNEVSSFLKTG